MNFTFPFRLVTLPRSATTLLEMILAMGIFVTVVVAISQGLIATRQYVGEDEIRTDLELESARLLNTFTKDLANATWFGEPETPFPSSNKDNPYVDSPLSFPNVGRAGPDSRWGDQLDFVKLRFSEALVQRPGDGRQAVVAIDDPANLAIDLDDFMNARVVPTLIANPGWLPGSDDVFLMPAFDSAVSGLTFEDNRSFANPAASPRLYRYIVRESPENDASVPLIARRGQLVRQYSNGPGVSYNAIPSHPVTLNDQTTIVPPAVSASANPWIDDAILTDNIKATNDPKLFPGVPGVTFDTYTTDPTLGQYQIRIRVILMKRPSGVSGDERVYRTLQATIAMRSN